MVLVTLARQMLLLLLLLQQQQLLLVCRAQSARRAQTRPVPHPS
jgi:hypothetical protein